MDERWQPLLWLFGAIIGYVLFMRLHPLRAAFATGFRFARTNFTLIIGLALLLVAHVAWQYWQQTGLGGGDNLALALGQWEDILAWIPLALHDLRSVFWFVVPMEIAFLFGTPLAFLTSWYWAPKLFVAFGKGHRWIAGCLVILCLLSAWWWSHQASESFGWGYASVPDLTGLHHLLRGAAELVWALILTTFFQIVLVLGAYRSHGTGTGRCRFKEAIDWSLKCFPKLLPIPCLAMIAIAINWFANDRLDLKTAPWWEGAKFVIMVLSGAIPLCVLLLQRTALLDAVKGGLHFISRTAWRYAWFLFLCLTHFFLLRLLDSYLLTSVLTNEHGVLLWHVMSAILRAGLVIWFVNALCLYFCIDVSQKKRAKNAAPPMKLATLQARIRRRPPLRL